MGILVVFLNLVVLITGVILLLRALPGWRLPALRWLSILIGSFCFISLCTLMVYSQDSFETKVFFSRLRFVSFGFLAPVWLLFLSATYKKWIWLQKPSVSALMLTPGIITAFFSVFPFARDFVITDFSEFSKFGLSVVSYSGGMWFPFHYTWSTFMAGASWFFGAYYFFKLKGVRRYQLLILITGSALGALTDFVVVGTNSDLRWIMFTSAAYLFTEGAVFYTVFRHRLLSIAPAAREKIFRDFMSPALVVDEDHEIKDFNTAAAVTFALDQNHMGQKLESVFPSLDLSKTEGWLGDSQGQSRYFAVKVDLITDEANIYVGQLIILQDLTLQKKVEEQLEKSLELKARIMDLVYHDLTDFLESQYEFSRNISANDEKGSIPKQLLTLNSSIFASKDVLANLISWSKGQELTFQAQRREFDIITLIRTAIESQQIKADAKDVQIIFDTDSSLFLVKTDTMMVESAVRNILSNALRASFVGQQVVIRLEKADQLAVIRIRDSGVGMADQQLSEVLKTAEVYFSEPGYRGSRYGLGLSLVKKFMTQLGGRFQIESKLGVGTQVTLEIPIDIQTDKLR